MLWGPAVVPGVCSAGCGEPPVFSDSLKFERRGSSILAGSRSGELGKVNRQGRQFVRVDLCGCVVGVVVDERSDVSGQAGSVRRLGRTDRHVHRGGCGTHVGCLPVWHAPVTSVGQVCGGRAPCVLRMPQLCRAALPEHAT